MYLKTLEVENFKSFKGNLVSTLLHSMLCQISIGVKESFAIFKDSFQFGLVCIWFGSDTKSWGEM